MSRRPFVLTVQYPGFEREERLHDLHVGPGIELAPLLVDPPRQLDAVSYASALVDAIADRARPVDVIVAWCMASTIGLEAARLLGIRDGVTPVLLALDGAPCTVEHVADAFGQAAGRYGGKPAACSGFTADDLRTDAPSVLAAMRAELSQRATATLSGAGRDDELVASMAAEVVDVSMDWLIHLVAAHNSDHEPWHGDLVVATSTNSPFPGSWPGVPQPRVVPIDCRPDDLITSPVVADLIAECASARAASRM